MIKRFNPPTHLDPMPYLSEWHHEMEDGSVQIWVQTNEVVDENSKPHWRRLGDLLERVWLFNGCIPEGSGHGGEFLLKDLI
jgi:hypothetical protein